MPGVPVPPDYLRPDPQPSPHLPTITKSGKHTLDDGSEFTYSTLDDYVQYFVSQGLVKNLADLVSNYAHLIQEIFFAWVRTGQLGCLFAVKLAQKPRENLWMPVVILSALEQGKSLGKLINDSLDSAAESHEAAVVIFPDIITASQIVDLINILCDCDSGRWYRTDDGIDPDPTKASSLVGLRWVLPSGESVNYALGFASIDTMSFTRHSPFTAIFLRIRDEKRTPKHKEDGKVQVHLADLDSTYTPQSVHDMVWKKTEEYRARLVEKEKSYRAKAKVTFALPLDEAKRLCKPKTVKLEKIHSSSSQEMK